MRRSSIPLAGLAALVLVLAMSTAAQAVPFSIEADNLEFSGDGQYVRAAGHVLVTSREMLLRADALEYSDGIATASGHVLFSTSDAVLEAAWLQVNLDTRIFAASDLRGQLGEYYVRADRVVPGPAGERQLQSAGLTRCDLDVPCYELRAGRITIDGAKVTIEQGWLILKGRRILPLPRITLDTSRMDEWPDLHLGYDDRGLYLDATFAMPLAERTSLILRSELATEDWYSIRAALNWKTERNVGLQPWIEYSRTDRWLAGLGAYAPLGSWRLSTAVEYGLDEDRTEASLILAGPPGGDLFGGRLHIEGFLTLKDDGNLVEEDRRGAALVWTGREEEWDRAIIRLSLGRILRTGSSSETYMRLETELEKRLNDIWGFALRFDYDGADRLWEEGEIGIIRYFHCYNTRFAYDWTDGTFGVSAGISF